MMGEDLKWAIGVALAGIAALGGYITRDRQVAKQIRDGDDRLHERVNDVERKYVRREELKDHLDRYERSVAELRSDLKEHAKDTTVRLDTIIAMQTRRE